MIHNPSKMAKQSAFGQCIWLLILTAAFWLVLTGPAWLLAGPLGLQGLSIAAVLCVVPGFVVLFISARGQTSANPASLVLLSTTMRLLVVLFGVLVVQKVRPDLQFWQFLVWIIVFYLATLLLETFVVLKQTQNSNANCG